MKQNKTCTVLHQVGVSFDLYYDARKHKIKKNVRNNLDLLKLGLFFVYFPRLLEFPDQCLPC